MSHDLPESRRKFCGSGKLRCIAKIKMFLRDGVYIKFVKLVANLAIDEKRNLAHINSMFLTHTTNWTPTEKIAPNI